MSKLEEMEVFSDVVALGGFSAAARARSLTPSGVSKLIRRLENRLGYALFKRDTSNVVLTLEGQTYLEGVNRVLEALSELDSRSEHDHPDKGLAGEIRVLCSSSIAIRLLAPHVTEFTERHPLLGLCFVLNNDPIKSLDLNVDLALYSAELVPSSLIAKRIATTKHLMCASPAYLHKHGMPREPRDLARHRCLNFSMDVPCNAWPVRNEGSRQAEHLDIHAQITANNSEMLIALARSGAGIARFTAMQAHEDLEAGTLVPVLQDYTPHANQSIYAVFHSRRYLNARVQVFLNFVEEKIAAGAWQGVDPAAPMKLTATEKTVASDATPKATSRAAKPAPAIA